MTFDEHTRDDAPDGEAWRGDVHRDLHRDLHRAEPEDGDEATLARLRVTAASDGAPLGLASRVEVKTLGALRRATRTSPEALVAFAVVVYLALGTQVPTGWPLALVACGYALLGLRGRVAQEVERA